MSTLYTHSLHLKKVYGFTVGILGLVLVISGCDGRAGADPTPTLDIADTPTPMVTDTDVMTDTETMTDTNTMTGTDAMTGTDTMTGTHGMTSTQTTDSTDTMTSADMKTDDIAIRASHLIGYNVYNRQDEGLGEIEDLMIGLNSGQVKYAVLSFGGFLDIGDKHFAVPLSAMEINHVDQTLIFDVSEERLNNLSGFDPDNYPDTANPDWDLDLRDAFTEEQMALRGEDGMQEFQAESAILASDLMGYNVENFQNEGLGEIEDLMIGLNSGQVKYAVLSFGGFLDIGDKLFAIPLEALELNAEEEVLMLDVDQSRLENAPGFNDNAWPDGTNPEWDADYHDFWMDAG